MYDCITTSPQVLAENENFLVLPHHLSVKTFITLVPLNTCSVTQKLIYNFQPPKKKSS